MKGIGKTLTLSSKVISVVWVAFWVIYWSFLLNRPLTPDEAIGIIEQGLFIVGVFLPIDGSLIIQNLKRTPTAV